MQNSYEYTQGILHSISTDSVNGAQWCSFVRLWMQHLYWGTAGACGASIPYGCWMSQFWSSSLLIYLGNQWEMIHVGNMKLLAPEFGPACLWPFRPFQENQFQSLSLFIAVSFPFNLSLWFSNKSYIYIYIYMNHIYIWLWELGPGHSALRSASHQGPDPHATCSFIIFFLSRDRNGYLLSSKLHKNIMCS